MREGDDTLEMIRKGLAAARSAPARVRSACEGLDDADVRRKPGVGKLALIEHVRHLLDMEQNVFGARLRRALSEDTPHLERLSERHFVDPESIEGQLLDGLLEEWTAARAKNVEIVRRAGESEWTRPVIHPELGEATLADVLLRWCRHDAEHIRQIAIVARNSRERNSL